MKLEQIIKVLSLDLGTSDLELINKALRTKGALGQKYKMMGSALGPLGHTVPIKSVSAEGLKVFTINKVILVRLTDIESFEKAKPRVKRPKRPPKAKKVKLPWARPMGDIEDDTDEDSEAPVIKRNKSRQKSFIPTKK